MKGLKFSCSLCFKGLLVPSWVNYLPNNVGLKICFVLLYLFHRFDLLSLEVYFIWCQPSLFWKSIWHAFLKLLIAKLRLYQNRQENKKTLFFQGGAKPNQSRHSQISVYFLLTRLSRGHFKVVSINSEVRFSHPDPYQRILLIQKELLDLEVDDISVTIPLQVEIFSLSFIGGNLCQKL